MPAICARCNREVRFAEEKLAFGKTWHTFCFSCRTCRKLLDSHTVAAYCGELHCKSCHAYLSTVTASQPQKQDPCRESKAPLENRVSCKIEHQNKPFSKSSRDQVHEKRRLRGGGSEAEVNCYYEGKEKQCSHSASPKKYAVLSPSEESLQLRSNTAGIRNTGTLNTGCLTARSFNESNHKFPIGQKDHSECTSQSTNSTFGYVPQTKDCPIKCEAPFKIRCPPSKNCRVHPQNRLDTELRCIKDSKELITRYSASDSVKSGNIPSRRKIPCPPPRDPLPSRRRVSFDRSRLEDDCVDECLKGMQDSGSKFCYKNETHCSEAYSHSCEIWRAEESAEKDEDDYDTALETSNAIHCEGSRGLEYTDSITHCANVTIHRTLDFNEDTTDGYGADKASRETSTKIENNDSIGDIPLKEIASHTSQRIKDEDFGEDERMRGGCCGSFCSRCGGRPSSARCPNSRVKDYCPSSNNCFTCCRSKTCSIQEEDPSSTTCCQCPLCCGERTRCPSATRNKPICKNPFIVCRQTKGCGQGGCCGSGCRGGCGRPGQTCLPLSPCSTPPCPARASSAGSPCSSSRSCAPTQSCCCSKKPVSIAPCARRVCAEKYGCGSSGTSCCGPRSSGCRSKSANGCCSNDGAKLSTDGAACCRQKYSGCECLGGGLDCQRCGRKVYQAEMQVVSGAPYHNICLSCYCCRKPLGPLTYQENCGEIYCKQCYVRNFGPQGYGYGVGAGALQTPL